MNFIKKEIATLKNNKNKNLISIEEEERNKNYYNSLMLDLDQIIKNFYNIYINKSFINKEIFMEIPSAFLTKIIKPFSLSSIYSIKNSDGILLTDKKEIINEFKNYYQNLYCKADFNCSKLVDLFQLWKPKINEEDIIKLTAEITIKELKFSVFASDSNKSSGPDGISNLFFKKAFKLINNNLLNTFNYIYNNFIRLINSSRFFII